MSARLPLPRVWIARRFWIVGALVCTLIAAPLLVQREDASASGPVIAVIGDSISARYDDSPGSDRQAWWSVVGRNYGAHVTTFAESGSGYVRNGHACTGTRFADRLTDVARAEPTIVIVEGGRNDWAFCKDGGFALTTDALLRKSVDEFFTKLKRAVASGTTIIVLGPPWGSKQVEEQARVSAIIKQAARRHDLTFIATDGVFTGDRTLDGIHPNRAGSMALGKTVIQALGPKLT